MSGEMKAWTIGYLLEFEEGQPEYARLQECDSEEECERIAELIPAVTYKGDRRVKAAQLIWTRNTKELPNERQDY